MRYLNGLLLLALFTWSGCRSEPDQKSDVHSPRIDQLIHAHRSNLNLDSLRAVLVITEEGCIPCSRAFAELVSSHLDDPSILFWISAKGTGIDISSFKAQPDHVIWDYDHDLQRSGLLGTTGAILLKGGEVDTIISIDARRLEPTLAFLREQLLKPASSKTDGGK